MYRDDHEAARRKYVPTDTEASEVQQVVHAYHRAWTTGEFDRAASLLSPSLEVEVPINAYPTREAFADALGEFGSRVDSVTVLSEMQSGDEAMVLYDMEVVGIGELRVVEHFTVSDGVIVRLRQIHDTAAIREASGLDGEHDGFRQEMVIAASPLQVFDALTSLEGLTGWWASSARGSGSAGGRFELGFAGLDERMSMHVDVADPTTLVAWTCLEHTGLPDWEGTKIVFSLTDRQADQTTLSFSHIGLVPDLECYEQCHAGWEHFLASLRSYVERGRGNPFVASVE
jgi:uncharacterized protein YndB with AHSA1/START domain/ketosteroid isomerase-like protein